MATSYGQYCPLALATELLCRRWTILVISRVVDGCHRFNEIHRGVHRMSPSLLSIRLKELEKAGLLWSRGLDSGQGHEYFLTEAGRELIPLINGMAVWGHRWARDMESADLEPEFLVWSMHTRLNTAAMPPGQTVLEFEFTGTPRDCRRFWLVNRDGVVEMCIEDPGLEVDLAVKADLQLFVEAWRGFRDLEREIAARRIRLDGDARLKADFPGWLLLSGLASNERRRPGRERRMAERTLSSARRQLTWRRSGDPAAQANSRSAPTP